MKLCSDRRSQSTQAESPSRRAPLHILRGLLCRAQLGSRRKKNYVNLLHFSEELTRGEGGSSLLKSALCLQKNCSCKTRHLISVNILLEGHSYSAVTATIRPELASFLDAKELGRSKCHQCRDRSGERRGKGAVAAPGAGAPRFGTREVQTAVVSPVGLPPNPALDLRRGRGNKSLARKKEREGKKW